MIIISRGIFLHPGKSKLVMIQSIHKDDSSYSTEKLQQLKAKKQQLLSEVLSKLSILYKEFTAVNTLFAKNLEIIQLNGSHNKSFIGYFNLVGNNMNLKLKCIKLEILISIYKQGSSTPVKELALNLSTIKTKIQDQQNIINQTLVPYTEFLGTDFEDIVSQYSRVMRNIEKISSEILQLQQES